MIAGNYTPQSKTSPSKVEGAGGSMTSTEQKSYSRNSPKAKALRRELRNHSTKAEKMLWNWLKKDQVEGLRFRRQYSVDSFILDFYCPKLRLCIELDGDYHFHVEQPVKDAERDELLERKYGIHTLRFENKIVINQPHTIIDAILSFAETKTSSASMEVAKDTAILPPPPSTLEGEVAKDSAILPPTPSTLEGEVAKDTAILPPTPSTLEGEVAKDTAILPPPPSTLEGEVAKDTAILPLASSTLEGEVPRRSVCALLIMLMVGFVLATSVAVHAQDKIPWTHGGPLLPDSSNFVTASLLVIEPGPKTVSAMGHSAIRLECPVHNLDYCFTLENNPEYSTLSFILGKTPAHDIAVPTNEFLKEFVAEKRRVMQYELNLTLHEKQELWRAADIEFTNEGNRLFNYSYDGTDNCTSICLELIEQALIGEKIVVDKMPNILTKDNGTYFRQMSRRSPWVQFLLITLGGTACDETWNMRNRMAPEVIVPLFEH